jgi:hypothetical protein
MTAQRLSCVGGRIAEREIAMRRLLSRGNVLIALMTISPLLTACSDAVDAELQRDELAYHNSVAQLTEDQDAGNATATDEHEVKLASTQLRQDRGVISGPNEHEHQEKEGHPK